MPLVPPCRYISSTQLVHYDLVPYSNDGLVVCLVANIAHSLYTCIWPWLLSSDPIPFSFNYYTLEKETSLEVFLLNGIRSRKDVES
jgi:hypothetical protein